MEIPLPTLLLQSFLDQSVSPALVNFSSTNQSPDCPKMKRSWSKSVELFSKQTTVHGLHIIGVPRLHFLERLFWVIMVAIGAAGAMAIAYSNWIRYSANPTVVSIQKDFRNWLNAFPAATGCFINRVDPKKAEAYVQEKWGVGPSSPSFDRYMSFIGLVSNVSYTNLKEFRNFANDGSLENVDMLELAIKVHPELTGTLVTFDAKLNASWNLIMSELGICFSVNSLSADLLALNKTTSGQNSKVLKCHYLNGLCYARFDSDPELALQYFIHSYLEVVHATSEHPLQVHESEELEINYRMQETESSQSLKYLSPSQRKCRFYDEPISDEVPVYSSSMCYMICRYKLAIKLCGCKPFFYHTFGGKVCDIRGLLCLAKHSEDIVRPPSQLNCDCPPPCDMIIYFPQVPKYTKWEYGYFEQRLTFRWALLSPTTKFLRDVLFGFEDLVVSFGGTLALFLGLSFISAIEIVFLIAENIYIYYKQKNYRHNLRVVQPKLYQ